MGSKLQRLMVNQPNQSHTLTHHTRPRSHPLPSPSPPPPPLRLSPGCSPLSPSRCPWSCGPARWWICPLYTFDCSQKHVPGGSGRGQKTREAAFISNVTACIWRLQSFQFCAKILACLCSWLRGSWLYNNQSLNTAEEPADPKPWPDCTVIPYIGRTESLSSRDTKWTQAAANAGQTLQAKACFSSLGCVIQNSSGKYEWI